MKKLLLARHSAPKINPDTLPMYWPLSDAGISQCKTLANYASQHNPSLIVSSLGTKAKETAKLVSEHLKLPYQVKDTFPQHDRRNAKLTQEQDEAQVARHFYEPDKLIFGEHTANQEHENFYDAISMLTIANPEDTLMAVVHGTAIALLVTKACKLDPMSFWLHLGTPSLIVVSWPKIELLDIIQHIDVYTEKTKTDHF